jgi:hypothetical protein
MATNDVFMSRVVPKGHDAYDEQFYFLSFVFIRLLCCRFAGYTSPRLPRL